MLKNLNNYLGSSVRKMVSQQASSRFMKLAIYGELMTKGGDLIHDSTIRTEKAPFDEPDEKKDGATSSRDR